MPTLEALAQVVGGKVLGDPHYEIRDLADLQNAGATDISFLANPKYLSQFSATKAGAVLVAKEIENAHTHIIVCANPYLAMAQIATALHPAPTHQRGISERAYVHPSADVDPTATVRPLAFVDEGAKVGARTVIEGGAHVGRNVILGDDVLLHPGAKVLDRCTVGHRCILHAGAVIGSDGFGYAPDAEGVRHKIPQVGVVQLGDDVEIGANTTIDRATFGVTKIGRGTKIDNLVQIAHNVKLDENCVAASQSGIAGSATIGKRVVIGAQVGVVGHIEVQDDVVLAARAGVTKGISKAGTYAGFPATPHREWLRFVANQRSIPEIKRKIRLLEKTETSNES